MYTNTLCNKPATKALLCKSVNSQNDYWKGAWLPPIHAFKIFCLAISVGHAVKHILNAYCYSMDCYCIARDILCKVQVLCPL